ncbi:MULTISPECIES: helix-turn-helix domain-containing protein [Streptomyces]|uniref:helix-turn-helix domain-containing protein n=1 Tax=Streptomyces lycopersici TaxID=2974589 RepID=UPI00293E276B|nr:helix-turn-helix transcriptional regulator [Streptomyces sp. NEAU-383]
MPRSNVEHTGARIAHIRRQRALTQKGLAMRANVSKSLLSKVECGQRPPRHHSSRHAHARSA